MAKHFICCAGIFRGSDTRELDLKLLNSFPFFFLFFFLKKKMFFDNARLARKDLKVMVKKTERGRGGKMGGMETLVENRH